MGLFGDGGDIRAWWRTGGCDVRRSEWTNGDSMRCVCVCEFGMQGEKLREVDRITHRVPSKMHNGLDILGQSI